MVTNPTHQELRTLHIVPVCPIPQVRRNSGN